MGSSRTHGKKANAAFRLPVLWLVFSHKLYIRGNVILKLALEGWPTAVLHMVTASPPTGAGL